MHGWRGRILHVDVGAGTQRIEFLPREVLFAYLGGRGLGVRLLREDFARDPFDPLMPVVFAAGPLCGTSAPASARFSVVSRSPLTGTVCDSSAGGRFAHSLKAAGFDALRITGRSARPVALAVTPGGAEILPADSLWGKTTGESARALAGRGSVAAIGPAGENGVLFANIVTGEGNAAGRGGLGAVLGAKKIKAVAVNGDIPVTIAKPARFEKAQADVMRLLRASPVIFGEFGIAEFGTAAFSDLLRLRRMTPTENFRRTVFEASRNWSGPAIRRRFRPGKDGCFDCPIRCKRTDRSGSRLPEYGTLSHLGALNGISDVEAVVRAGILCTELGMDTISAGATLAAWGEARERFVRAQDLENLLRDVAWRRAEGGLLALGSRRLAEAIENPRISMAVKGLELPAYDPRGAYGLALALCTSNRGGCHLRAYTIGMELLRRPVAIDRFSFDGKARIVKICEDASAAADSLPACRFAFLGASLEEYAELFAAATGEEADAGRLQEIGERIVLTERFYNAACGFARKDDALPARFFEEPGTEGGGIEIPPLDRQRFEEELDRYYRIRGLTAEGTFSDPEFLSKQP